MPRAIFNDNGFVDWLIQEEQERGFVNNPEDDLGPNAFIIDINLAEVGEGLPWGPLPDPPLGWEGWAEPPNGLVVINRMAPDRDADGIPVARPFVPQPFEVRVRNGPMAEKPMDNGPELWKFLLEQVRTVYECEAVIAGGCVRDHILKINPKDIDIFVDHNFPEIILQDMVELNWGDAFSDAPEAYEGDAKIKGSWTFGNLVKGHTINLIAKPLPVANYAHSLINSFDFEICKGWYTGDGTNIDITENAVKDIEEKTFTFCGDKKFAERSINRYQRFIKRTGLDYKLVGLEIPEPKAVKLKKPTTGSAHWDAVENVFAPEAGRIINIPRGFHLEFVDNNNIAVQARDEWAVINPN